MSLDFCCIYHCVIHVSSRTSTNFELLRISVAILYLRLLEHESLSAEVQEKPLCYYELCFPVSVLLGIWWRIMSTEMSLLLWDCYLSADPLASVIISFIMFLLLLSSGITSVVSALLPANFATCICPFLVYHWRRGLNFFLFSRWDTPAFCNVFI